MHVVDVSPWLVHSLELCTNMLDTKVVPFRPIIMQTKNGSDTLESVKGRDLMPRRGKCLPSIAGGNWTLKQTPTDPSLVLAPIYQLLVGSIHSRNFQVWIVFFQAYPFLKMSHPLVVIRLPASEVLPIPREIQCVEHPYLLLTQFLPFCSLFLYPTPHFFFTLGCIAMSVLNKVDNQ